MSEIPKDFPWRAGMLVLSLGDVPAFRIVNAPPKVHLLYNDLPVEAEGMDEDGEWCGLVNDGSMGAEPDHNDPATLGALLGAVREAYGDPLAYIVPDHAEGWFFYARICGDDMADGLARGPTEFDALLAAWNARPVKQ